MPAGACPADTGQTTRRQEGRQGGGRSGTRLAGIRDSPEHGDELRVPLGPERCGQPGLGALAARIDLPPDQATLLEPFEASGDGGAAPRQAKPA
ncbi:hypothetical protein SAMN02927895_04735 [Belnapia rosea]|nr:hypothetical protein SAMN02927895_04735 [Belnapia rosea]